MTTDLLTPILDGGIRNTHFFNGRLLTAQDLQEMQEANRLQHHQLGQAVGTGVVWGLEVGLVDDGSSGDPPVISVNAGLAVNRFGQALTLPVKTDVLLAESDEAVPQDAGLFQTCTPPKGGLAATAEGVYVLTIKLASGFREWVPKRGFGQNGEVDGCGRRYKVEGVQFRLEELSLDSIIRLDQDTRDAIAALMEEIDALRFKPDVVSQAHRRARLSRLRNWLAHVCLGTEEVASFSRDPFEHTGGQSPYLAYGAADALRAEGQLTDCDVPLALIYWTTNRVHFVDMWSVRRRLTPQLYSAAWPLSVNRRWLAEEEAKFLQFQQHVEQMTRPNVPQYQLALVKAVDYFRYLPAVGIIPLAEFGATHGFDRKTFFSTLTYREPRQTGEGKAYSHIAGAKMQMLIRSSLHYPSIDVTGGEMMWLYVVRENVQAVKGGALDSPQPYAIFTNGHIPFLGDAQYDLAYWDYGNYGLGVAEGIE
jgi:hypothetical protein